MDIAKLSSIAERNDLALHDVVITGGEPTLHKDFLNVVRLMCRKTKTVSVTSNGTLNLHIDELKDYDNLCFQISLDGDLETHNKIRGANAFERTWDTLLHLDHAGAAYTIASVVSRKNRKEIFNLIPYLSLLPKLRYWSISYEMPFGTASFKQMMTASEWNSFVSELLHKANCRVKIKKIFPFDLYEKRKDELEKGSEGIIRSTNCGCGKTKIYVYPDFNVYPCTCLTDFCVGNLEHQSLAEILDSTQIKTFSEYKLSGESECQLCEYKKYCNGGCIGMSYHYFGKLGMGDKRCPKIFNR